MIVHTINLESLMLLLAMIKDCWYKCTPQFERLTAANNCMNSVGWVSTSEDNFLGRTRVNKADLVDAIAESSDISKAAASRALDATINSITDALKSGDTVSLVGFGTFSVKDRAARTGRNPQTGAPIEIAAAKVPGFKAGKALKDAVN